MDWEYKRNISKINMNRKPNYTKNKMIFTLINVQVLHNYIFNLNVDKVLITVYN